MSRREFTKVSPNVWRSKRFKSVSPSGKVVYLYYLTCEHQNSTGCFRLPDGYACADLAWTVDDYAAARSELIQADLISFDEETSLIYVHRWFKHSPPMNDKHAQGTLRQITEIECDAIRERVEQEFVDANGLRNARAPVPSTCLAGRISGGRI